MAVEMITEVFGLIVWLCVLLVLAIIKAFVWWIPALAALLSFAFFVWHFCKKYGK